MMEEEGEEEGMGVLLGGGAHTGSVILEKYLLQK